MLEQFKAIRDATRRRTAGKLTVVYESEDEAIYDPDWNGSSHEGPIYG